MEDGFRERIFISMNWKQWIMIFSAIILALTISIEAAPTFEVVLSIHENFTQENCTFQVEDIDTQAGKVWLLLQEEQEPSQSMVLGINDSIDFDRLRLMVTGTYAGERADLVCLRINSSNPNFQTS
jgi:hypothetical protein